MDYEAVCALLIIAIIAFILLVVDRHLRVSMYIEPFDGTLNARCGVDLSPCDFPLQCMNGLCKSTNPPILPKSTGLPVLP